MFTEQDTLCIAQADDAMTSATANYVAPPPFTPPLKSRATRKIPWRSPTSCRGSIVVRLNGIPVTLHFESLLELMVIMQLLARGDVVEIWDQPPPITYCRAGGKLTRHTYDFLVALEDGRKIAIAVKNQQRAAAPGFQANISRVAQATPKAFADDVVVISEADFTRAQVMNAARYFEFNKHSDDEADMVVQTVIDKLQGAVSVQTIVEQTKLGSRAYRSIFKAIFTNKLKVQSPDTITPKIIVSPVRKGEQL